ncbi:DivIVA domain protein, partial [Streptomyces sp. SID7804]|nr:DivIVA domain protein [Streptomyces sp. SID7804]
ARIADLESALAGARAAAPPVPTDEPAPRQEDEQQ